MPALYVINRSKTLTPPSVPLYACTLVPNPSKQRSLYALSNILQWLSHQHPQLAICFTKGGYFISLPCKGGGAKRRKVFEIIKNFQLTQNPPYPPAWLLAFNGSTGSACLALASQHQPFTLSSQSALQKGAKHKSFLASYVCLNFMALIVPRH